MAILYRVLSWIHALILYFSDINAPRVGSRRGTAHGAALLTKWGETAMMKTERAPLLAVGFPYQLIIIMLTVQLPLGGQHAFMDRYITPLRLVPVWDGALDKSGRDCYHKNRKSVATSGWLRGFTSL